MRVFDATDESKASCLKKTDYFPLYSKSDRYILERTYPSYKSHLNATHLPRRILLIYLRHSLGTIRSDKITVTLQLNRMVNKKVRSKFLLDVTLFCLVQSCHLSVCNILKYLSPGKLCLSVPWTLNFFAKSADNKLFILQHLDSWMLTHMQPFRRAERENPFPF